VAAIGLWSATLNAESPPWPEPPSDFGGAVPLNQSGWYRVQDYPTSAISSGKEGMVVVGFTIGADGRVTDCQVTQSSKHKELDNVPCRALKSRARFTPATDDQGQPKATTGTTVISFWMPR
jgi:protein TonB